MSKLAITYFSCFRSPMLGGCKDPGCGTRAVYVCEYPVMRDGKPATCDRPLCERHTTVIDNKKHCAVHAKLAKKKEPAHP